MTQSTTSENILFALKKRGPLSAKQVAETFSISVMGAHKALNALADQQLVEGYDESRGRGRPTRLFKLTEKGHSRFPDNHADLTVEVIRDVRTLFGKEGLDQVIAAREARQKQSYGARMQGGLSERADILASLRSDEGYMARTEQGEDGSMLLIEDHCPICAAAEACQGFCRSELSVFQAALGEDFHIEREEHLLSGGRRCTYRIKANKLTHESAKLAS